MKKHIKIGKHEWYVMPMGRGHFQAISEYLDDAQCYIIVDANWSIDVMAARVNLLAGMHCGIGIIEIARDSITVNRMAGIEITLEQIEDAVIEWVHGHYSSAEQLDAARRVTVSVLRATAQAIEQGGAR